MLPSNQSHLGTCGRFISAQYLYKNRFGLKDPLRNILAAKMEYKRFRFFPIEGLIRHFLQKDKPISENEESISLIGIPIAFKFKSGDIRSSR